MLIYFVFQNSAVLLFFVIIFLVLILCLVDKEREREREREREKFASAFVSSAANRVVYLFAIDLVLQQTFLLFFLSFFYFFSSDLVFAEKVILVSLRSLTFFLMFVMGSSL